MRLEYSAIASQDRDAIFDYIEADNPSAAIAVDHRIREQVARLIHFPELGRPGKIDGTRELVINHTPYLAAYRIAGDTINILRILHGAQLWPEQMEQ